MIFHMNKLYKENRIWICSKLNRDSKNLNAPGIIWAERILALLPFKIWWILNSFMEGFRLIFSAFLSWFASNYFLTCIHQESEFTMSLGMFVIFQAKLIREKEKKMKGYWSPGTGITVSDWKGKLFYGVSVKRPSEQISTILSLLVTFSLGSTNGLKSFGIIILSLYYFSSLHLVKGF